jgi:hypothetical protein
LLLIKHKINNLPDPAAPEAVQNAKFVSNPSTLCGAGRTPSADGDPRGGLHKAKATIDHSVQQIRDLINDPVRHAVFCAAREKETGERWDPEESKRRLKAGRLRAVQTSRAWSLKQMVEMLLFFQKRFMQMRLFFVHANDAFFLTSDYPVRVHDPATARLLPRSFQSFEMLFPLSREYCLAGAYSAGPAQLELEADQVHNLNRRMVRQADRFVYSPFHAPYIQSELEESHRIKSATQHDDVIQF